jgi:hypothetical protein
MQYELAVIDDDRVTGVSATLAPRDDVNVF